MTRRLAREEGLLVGGSCGMAAAAALRVAAGLGPEAVVVVLLPDGGRGYLSKIFSDEWMADYGFLAQLGEISVGDASSSKVFAADQVQGLLDDLTRVVHRYGDLSDDETGALGEYLDAQAKRNLVLTFGGGVQEVQRELIGMFGLGLPRVPR